MEDRHSAEIASAIRGLSSAIHSAGWMILMGLIYAGCMVSIHH